MRLTLSIIFSLCVILFFSYTTFGQKINTNWETDINTILRQFKACGDNSCYQFQGTALKTIYTIDDFYSSQQSRYLTTNEIYDFLKESALWEKLGPAYDSKVLIQAQEYANSNKATVAVYMGPDGLGHIAFIVPGDIKPSGSWRIGVPNSVSLFLADRSKSYIGKGLSYSFARNVLKSVEIYSRKY